MMLLLFLFLLGVALIAAGIKSNDYHEWMGTVGAFLTAVSLILAIPCVVSNLWTGPALEARASALTAEWEFLTSLPTPVPDISQSGAGGGFSVDIDQPNRDLARVLVEQRVDFYQRTQRLNESLLFWELHPKIAFCVWITPNPSAYLKARKIKPIDFSEGTP